MSTTRVAATCAPIDMLPNGTIAKETSRVFVDLGGTRARRARRHQSGHRRQRLQRRRGGLYIIDSKGKKLGRIVHGQAATTNVAFGGDDWKTLYFTTASTLFSVNVKIAGVPVPAKRTT